MKIVSVSIIRNESDILETFVRYHQQIIDHMIIVNHRSTDSSGEILKNLAGEGARLELVEETALEQPQRRVLTTMMKRAVRDYCADWVIPLDADEFITAPGGNSVREVLSGLPRDKVVHVPWRTYVPLPTDNWSEADVLRRIRHRRTAENLQYYKVCIPACYGRESGADLLFGSHRLVKRSLFSKQKDYPFERTDSLAFAHFPVRSGDQIITKAITGWLANLANPRRSSNENLHFRDIYNRFCSGLTVGHDELTAIALGYAGDPQFRSDTDVISDQVLPEKGDYEILYSTAYESEPLSVLSHLSEEFARALASLRRNNICIRKRFRG